MSLEQIKKPKEIKLENKEKQKYINQKTKQSMDELMKEIQRRQSIDKVINDKYLASKNDIDVELVERMGYKDFEEFKYEINNILKDGKYKEVLKKIEEKFPELKELLNKKGNIILNYYIIRFILPYLFAGAMSKKKILEIIEMLLDKMIIYPRFKQFFKKFEEFLKKYATPDGEAVKIFISSESWR